MKRIVCLSLVVGVCWISCANENGPTAPDQSDTGLASATAPASSQLSNFGSSEMQDVVDIHCDFFDDARIRFGKPGDSDGHAFTLFLALRGMPDGKKNLRLWWDWEYEPNDFLDFIVHEDQFEDLLKQEYSKQDPNVLKKVRIEVTAKGKSGHCVRVRHIELPEPIEPGKRAGAPVCGGDGVCTVFVTSTRHTGNLGGLSGADAICQTRANAATLSGAFKAWLADGSTSPSSRLTQANLPYRLVTGTTIADNWSDLTDGTLDAAIRVDELGGSPSTGFTGVWTNADTDGSSVGAQHCSNWTGTGDGIGGVFTRTNASWTADDLFGCVQSLRLYCFEQ